MNDVGRQPTAGKRNSAAPSPAIIGDQRRAARAVGIEFAARLNDGRRVVYPDLAVERKNQRSHPQGCCEENAFHLNPRIERGSTSAEFASSPEPLEAVA